MAKHMLRMDVGAPLRQASMDASLIERFMRMFSGAPTAAEAPREA